MTRLDGRVVATTRDGDPEDGLVAALRAAGARVVEWPTLSFAPTECLEALRDAVEGLDEYDWVVFTSARSVGPVLDLACRSEAPTRVAAVGAATADALRARAWIPTHVGDGGSEGLIASLSGRHALRGTRVLFPAGSRAHTALEEALAACGATVHRVEAYRTLETPPDPGMVLRDLALGVDTVTFTSPSAIDSLARSLDDAWPDVLGACAIVAIGATTADAARRLGLDQVVTAAEPSLEALVEACAQTHTPTR